MTNRREDENRLVSPGSVLYFIFCAVYFGFVFSDIYPGEYTGLFYIFMFSFGVRLAIKVRNYRVRRNLRSNARRQSMENGFEEIVCNTEARIKDEYIGDPSIQDPNSGVYQVQVKETAICDSKSNNVLHGGFEKPSILKIQVAQMVGSDGWFVQGTRTTTGKEFYVISEGFVSPSGKAYWVETCNFQSILVCGDFIGENFTGEWLSSGGERGSYTDFEPVKVVEADTAIVMGSEATIANGSSSANDPLLVSAV